MEQTAKPAFEVVLSGIESAPADRPLEPDQLQRLTDLYHATREHYARILNGMLGAEIGAPSLPLPLLHGAQMLHRRLANAFGQAALRLALQADVELKEVAALAGHSLDARAEEIKWHAFESTMPSSASWRNANALFLGLESLDAERHVLVDGSTCTDAFGQCILLATLNVGMLSAPQMELAHRWLSVSGWGLRIEPYFDPEVHWYQIDLEQSRGPERISPDSAISDATRFIAVSTLGPMLAQARAKLYSGELSVPATPNRIAALHFGAFLDLAERLWSPDWRKTTWRAPRTAGTGEKIEVVVGFERVLAALGETAGAVEPDASWLLRDKCGNGLAALLSDDAGIGMRLGILVAFRGSAEDDWQLGYVVRRVRAADQPQWLAGIKRISDSPVALPLTPQPDAAGAKEPAAREPMAIYAPASSGAGRIDSLLLDADEFARGGQYRLPTRGGAFRIKLNRVIDRGDRWVRVGFEVLGKQ